MAYNTEEIRAMARRVNQQAGLVSALQDNRIRKLMREAETSLSGNTAEAYISALKKLASTLKKLESDMEGIGTNLSQFARRIDLADAQSRNVIQNR